MSFSALLPFFVWPFQLEYYKSCPHSKREFIVEMERKLQIRVNCAIKSWTIFVEFLVESTLNAMFRYFGEDRGFIEPKRIKAAMPSKL